MASKRKCSYCKQAPDMCDCFFSRRPLFPTALLGLVGMLAIGCTSPAQKAAEYGTRDLGLTGVSIESLCSAGEVAFQLRGQKFSASIPVVDQRFQLGVAQVLCCSSSACRVSGESTLFPRPSFVGAGDMIEQWKQKLPSVSWPSAENLPSLPRFDGGYRAPENAVPIPVSSSSR